MRKKCYYFKMKKFIFLWLFLILTPIVSSEESRFLKLRANFHPEFLRIVLEGTEPLISKAVVNQKGKDILVRFPYSKFTIQEEKVPITYKIDKDTILFSPGYFRKLTVFSLKYPSRLVIDVYLDSGKKDAKPLIKSEQPEKDPSVSRVKTVVIDPGHGGYESGIAAKKYKEKNVVLDIAKRLSALIIRGSTQCLLTRKSDQFMSLGERVKFTNHSNADVFLSLHVGKHSDIVLYTPVITESVPDEAKAYLVNKGQEDYMVKTAALLNSIRQAIIEDFGNEMVSTKPLPYSILSRIETAALMIELPSFEDSDYVADFKTKLANTLYKGIYLYEENTAN